MKHLEEKFIGFLTVSKKSADTINNYMHTLRSAERFFEENFSLSLFKEEDLMAFKPTMFDDWVAHIASKGLADGSQAQQHTRMRAYLRWAYDREYTSRDYTRLMPHIKAEPVADDPTKVYSDDDIVNMLEIASRNRDPLMAARDAAIIALLAGSAMRVIELASLTVGDYLKARRSRVLPQVRRKGGKIVDIPYAEFVAPYIDNYLILRSPQRDEDALFTSIRSGNPMSRSDIYHAIAPIQERAGVRQGLHNFRHTVITRIARSYPTGIASAVAGHSSTDVTQRHYIHASAEDRRSVVDSLSINDLLKNI